MGITRTALALLTVIAILKCSNAGENDYDKGKKGCSKQCSHGQVLDTSSCKCEQDRNKESKCKTRKCAAGPFPCKEYKKDDKGCKTCMCLDRCSRSRCPRTCREGTESYVDEKGCHACRCRSKSYSVCSKQLKCAKSCEGGHVKDINGCDTCTCNSYSKCNNQAKCASYCKNGYVKDQNGCDTCGCR